MAPDAEELRVRLHGLGFDVVRFAPLGEHVPDRVAFERWLGDGLHADMAWMERSREKRTDPRLILPAARSLIMLGVNYGPGEAPGDGPRWARYALHRDYHDTIRSGLVAAGTELEKWADLSGHDYRYYVDTGPVLERSWARVAGMGFTGKNAMLISREFGNWLFLAAILVRWELPADPPVSRRVKTEPVGALCGRCTKCLDACPTGALPAPGVVDARRCISYQTIENKGIIPREMRAGIGNRIYGCDICAEVCPWNRFAQQARSGLLEARPELARMSLEELLRLTPEKFAVVFQGTAIKRLKLPGLLRNACIVAGNAGCASRLTAVMDLARHHPAVTVRAHAVWAARKLGGNEVVAPLRATETALAVRREFDAEL